MAPPDLAAFRLPPTRALAGRKFTLETACGGTVTFPAGAP